MSFTAIPNPLLDEILATQTVETPGGKAIELHSDVGRVHAEALHRLIRAERPSSVVEVGLAFGVSALAILTALEQNGVGHLVSIDPMQSNDDEWAGIGVANIERAGLAHRHRFIEDSDYLALPELVRSGERFQFAYVDGWHTFDHTLLDLFYCDKLLEPGGVIGVNDAGLPAVHRAIQWLVTHRHYDQVAAGLDRCPAVSDRRRRIHGVLSRLAHGLHQEVVPIPIASEDLYLRKLDEFEPSWDFYSPAF